MPSDPKLCKCGRAKTCRARCLQCYNDARREGKAASDRHCASCGGVMDRKAKGERCAACIVKHGRLYNVRRVIHEEAEIAPRIEPVPKEWGSAVVATDLHIPWHAPAVLTDFCESAVLLGIKTLIVGGDLIHADLISKYVGVAKSIPVTDELRSCGRVLHALEEIFDRIIIIPGNHDQRVERMIAGLRDTDKGRKGLEMVAALLGAGDIDDAEDMSLRYLRHFLGSPKVTWHPLPQMELNGTWLIQHPGTVSRIAPQTERAMIRKHRKSVIEGHAHTWGVGFDESAIDVAFNCGHGAADEKWRYMREKPTSFPKGVKGYGIVYSSKDNPGGRLIPVAIHDRMFRLRDIIDMAREAAS